VARVVLINNQIAMPRYMVFWEERLNLDDAKFTVVERRHDQFYDSYWWCMKHKSAGCKCIDQVVTYRQVAMIEPPPEETDTKEN
jgi:hypothetical protein